MPCLVTDIMKHACYVSHIFCKPSISILRDTAPCETALVAGDFVKQQSAVEVVHAVSEG